MSKILFLLIFLPVMVFSQNDSTLLLAPERLTEHDILPRDLSSKKVVASSATRSLESVDDSPFTIYVFTAADILSNGFVTLTDVLKAAPGIQVSQPGNAVEGETFMVRGLSGNQYMKVLINDIPVKPSMTLGMPIGSQLPIRQAERIEIMYSPAGAIYGDETCAGVVNIILKESERPVYTQADLGFGSFGYNSLDLMFGGKIGKDKKIFRFSLYGSSTVRDQTDIFSDKSIYHTKQYLPFGLDSSTYLSRQNYRSSPANGDEYFPRLSQIPHESRLFGINLTWRGLHVTYHRMLRFDHSSIGLNPLAISYANPSNRFAERIETLSLGFNRQRSRRTSYNNFSIQRYSVENSSTTTYVFDRLSAASFVAQGGLNLPSDQQHALTDPIYAQYDSEERFATARGADARIESRMNVLLGKRKRLQWDAGGQALLGLGVPLFTNYTMPVELNRLRLIKPDSIQQTNFNLVGFTQLAWHSKHLHLVGGGSVSARLNEKIVLAPRFGVLYHVDSSWTIRSNIAAGFRHSNSYGNANSYITHPQDPSKFEPGNLDHQPEKNYAAEFAIRYSSKAGSVIEGTLFWQEAQHLFRPGYLVEESGALSGTSYGFKNAPGLALALWGFQGTMRSQEGKIPLTVNKKDFPIITWFEYFTQYSRGREWFGYGLPATNEIRNQPKWNNQFRFHLMTGKKFEMVLATTHQSSRLSKTVIFKDQYQLPDAPRLDNFRTWDLMTRLYLSNHFLIYIQLINAFDRHYAGIGASGTPDDLLYNPQPGRQWRLGVNYNMN